MEQILLDTVHGSHLYGLAHAGSDRDRYVVVARRPSDWVKARWAQQSIDGTQDVFTTDLASFLSMCDAGVPQALEAMFSAQATVDALPDFRRAYRAGVMTAGTTYRRTVKSFALAGDVKRRRHALRLAVNLSQLLATGRFSPTLDPTMVLRLTDAAVSMERTAAALDILCPVRITLA